MKVRKPKHVDEEYEETSTLQVFFTYLCYTMLNMFGHFRDFLRKYGFEKRKGARDPNPKVRCFDLK